MPYGFRVLVDRPSAFFPNTEFDDGRSINNSHSIHTSHLGLIYRFVRTGGGPMLKMMGAAPDSENQHGHHEHHDAM